MTEPVAEFEEGDILDVTARFGDWHAHDLKLESTSTTFEPRTLIVTESSAGFSETEILDETARIGDWHERDLKFRPYAQSVAESASSSGPVRLTTEQFRRIADPVDATVGSVGTH